MSNINLLIRVSELYYFQNWTQQKIADEIGVSRASVSRLLDEARERGIIEISIKSESNRDIELEKRLKEKYALKDVIVFKSLGSYDYDLVTLGDVAVQYLNEVVKDGISIGISWGQSVQSIVGSYQQTNHSGITVTQVNGGIRGDSNTRYIADLVLSLSQKLNAYSHLLEAPAYVSSEELKNELLSQPQIVESFEEMSKLDIVITGVGDLDVSHNTLYSSGNLTDADIDKLTKGNVVGHILGRMYDSNGHEVVVSNKHPIAMSLSDLVATPNKIGAVITASRMMATKVAIEAKFINILVCDDSLANALLDS